MAEVDERNAVGIAGVAGVVAALSGAQPTGSMVVDWLLIVLFVGAVVWASASAPWWAPAGAAGVAAAVALQPVLALIGAVAFVVGLVIGVRRRDQAELLALVSAVALNVLVRSRLDEPFALSAVVGVVVGAVLFVVGVRGRPSAVRGPAWIAGAAVGVVGVVAVVVAGLSVLSVREDLADGNRQARQAVDLLDEGDYQEAATRFADASRSFSSVERGIGSPLARLAVLVPGVAQNVTAGSDLAAAASETAASIAAALEVVDPDSLRVVDGRIDVEAIRAVEQPLTDVQASITSLQQAIVDARSPWLLGRLDEELDELEGEFTENQPRLDNAVEAVRLAPQLLGAVEPRRYLVMFVSPVEARGLVGFFGNYAIVEIDDGRIDVVEFGRRSDLEQYVRENGAACDGCAPEMMANYGRFGLDVGDGSFSGRGWSAVTLPAHFPYVGEAAQILLPQSGGGEIDGVIALDPHVVEALMGYTGPVELAEIGITVESGNAAEFLLEGQYRLLAEETDVERIEAIDTLGQRVIEELLAGALPVPSTLARDLGPLVAEQRLVMWSDDPAEQAFLDRIGMDGALPPIGDDGGFGVMVSNVGHSKIDAFLDRTVDVTIDERGDERVLVADVTFTNDAPATGLPPYMIGNDYGFDSGTSLLWVNFFGPDALISASRNGEPVELEVQTEAGWTAHHLYEPISAGQSVTYRLEFALGPDSDGVPVPVVWEQPLARRAR